MDNKDLPLAMAEMLMEMQQLNTRITRLETAFFGAADSATGFGGEIQSLRRQLSTQHLEVLELVDYFTNALTGKGAL